MKGDDVLARFPGLVDLLQREPGARPRPLERGRYDFGRADDDALMRRLQSEDPEVCRAALEALVTRDHGWEEDRRPPGNVGTWVNAVRSRVGDEHAAVRILAARWLGLTGAAAGFAVDDLVRATLDADPHVRAEAADALGRCVPEEGAPDVPHPGGFEVPVIPGVERIPRQRRVAMATLTRLLDDPELRVRTASLGALVRLGPPSAVEREWLVAALTGVDSGRRDFALAAFAGARVAPVEAHAALCERLTDARPAVRRLAARALADASELDLVTLRQLRARLDESDSCALSEVVRALARPTPGSWQWRSRLVELARDAPLAVRRAAVDNLATVLDVAPELLAPLVEAASDRDSGVRESAVRGLAASTVPEVMHVVARALGDRSDDVQLAALDVLAAWGAEAAHVAPRLIARFRNEQEPLRLRALSVLVSMGSGAVLAILASVKAHIDDRWFELQALVELGPQMATMIPRVMGFLEDGALAATGLAILESLDVPLAQLVPDVPAAARVDAALENALRTGADLDPSLVEGLARALVARLEDRPSRPRTLAALARLGAPASLACSALQAIIREFEVALVRWPPVPDPGMPVRDLTYYKEAVRLYQVWTAELRAGPLRFAEAAAVLARLALRRIQREAEAP